MGYPRIIDKVYREPWAIKASVHHSIQASLSSALNGDRCNVDEDEFEESEEYYSDGGVSIIPINGIIGKNLSTIETMFLGCVDVDSISLALDAAVMDESTARIILYIDSCGGTVTGIPELADKVAQAAQVKEVIAYTDSGIFSAAYWIASQANWVYCSPSAEVGSIGVYMALLDESERLEQEGIKVNAFTAGKYKLSGSPFKPLTDEERAIFQADVDYWYELFTQAILNKRQVDKDVMQGQSFVGPKAVQANLVDGLVDSFGELLTMTQAN